MGSSLLAASYQIAHDVASAPELSIGTQGMDKGLALARDDRWHVPSVSLKDLRDIVHELKSKGVALKATEQPVNTSTAAEKNVPRHARRIAEFETNLRRERQLEGIHAAKARGTYKGRKPSIDAAEVVRLRRSEKLGAAEIARRLGIGRAGVYRVLSKN